MKPLTVEALTSAEAWPHPVDAVELIETHVSWVFLTGEFAYKIKKPVNFGFLDFSTLQKRRHCCEEELRLNRRLAPELYLDVVPITGSADAPSVGGRGKAFEYAVRMRQFDTAGGFDHLAARGELGRDLIDETAQVLARFHAGIDTATSASGYGTPEVTSGRVLENFDQIGPNIGEQAADRIPQFEQLESWSRAGCEAHADAFMQRLDGGFVRECHGDLHLRNIVLWQGQVVPFDCIEFNPDLRWIDVTSELAFLLMDLDDHGLEPLSRRLLDAYLEYSGDFEGLKLLHFYQVYRAMVRAKVASLRLAQVGNDDEELIDEMGRYMDLAERYTQPSSPRLIIAHGLSGSGKTFVSGQLLEAAPVIRLRSDVERKRLFGFSPLEPSGSARDAGIYSLEANTRTYARLLALAGQLLDSGWPVLVDAAFLKREERDAFRKLAESLGVPFAIMHCEADMPLQRERVAARRGDASEANLEVLDLQVEREEPLQADEQVIAIDTSGEPDLDPLLAFLTAD